MITLRTCTRLAALVAAVAGRRDCHRNCFRHVAGPSGVAWV